MGPVDSGLRRRRIAGGGAGPRGIVQARRGKNTPGEATGIEYERAVDHLSQMVKAPTVSSRNPQEVDEGAFEDFRRLLEALYPRVTAACPRERIGRSGLLLVEGKTARRACRSDGALRRGTPGRPHRLAKPPFCGELDDGRRPVGTRDAGHEGAPSAASWRPQRPCWSKGIPPSATCFFLFGDEEIMGPSAPEIVDVLEQRGIHPALVLDEGGAIVEGAFPGVKEKDRCGGHL